MGEAWIIDAVRTPRGRGKKDTGALAETHPQELLATALRALAARNAFDPRDVDDVIAGCVTQAGDQGACITRSAVLLAEWPQEVTGVSLNRFCGSGLQGVNFGLMGVMSGQQDLVVGGGVESMSRQPIGSDGAGLDGNNPDLRTLHPIVPQGISADLIATLEGFSRQALDTFAAQSQARAAAAQKAGRFDKSLVPVVDKTGRTILDVDEYPRPGTTVETLSALKPSFEAMGALRPYQGESLDEMALRVYPEAGQIKHVHHAGNSSGIVDGAAAVLIASPEYARTHDLKPRARVRSVATAGAEPVIMLTAPTPASRKALKKAGMGVQDIDLWEINEAFAVVPLKTIRDLELDPETVNVNGGAIALGHPIGASGARVLVTLIHALQQRDLKRGIASLCLGGGEAVALAVELE
jgi:acetyl-CoA C-acetyltransferase